MVPEPLIKLSPGVIYYRKVIQSKAVRDQWLLQLSMKGSSVSMRNFFFSKFKDSLKRAGMLKFQNSWLKVINKTL